MAKKSSYVVGYGQPPKHSQFKKGQSGNPNGRPKGSLNVASVLERTLREKVIINENGKRQEITKLEAALKQLVNKAAAGDLRAVQMLTGLARSAEEQLPEDPVTKPSESDRKVIENLMMRFERSMKNGKSSPGPQ